MSAALAKFLTAVQEYEASLVRHERGTDSTEEVYVYREAVVLTARELAKAHEPQPDDPPARPAVCLDCGKPYAEFPLDVVLPRSQWLEIHPDEHGLLCAGCIVARAAKVPGATVAHLVIEFAPRPRQVVDRQEESAAGQRYAIPPPRKAGWP